MNLRLVEWENIFSKISLIIGVTLLTITLINIGSLLHATSVPKGILFANDNDAGRAIQTTIDTRWYNSNHFAPYGNFYFRIAHTIAKLAPAADYRQFNNIQKEEVTHHFALKLTSLISLTVLCLLLAFSLTKDWILSFGISAILLRIFFSDEMMVKYVFRAHPDHLLMLMTGVAVFFTFQYMNDRSDKNFRLAAIFWGLGFAVKRSLVLFIPSLALMFLLEGRSKTVLHKAFRFVGWMLVAYLLVGFPQNFGFVKHIKFLLSESHNSQPADLESIVYYFNLMAGQIGYVLVPVVLLHVLWGEQVKIRLLPVLSFTAVSLIILFSRKMMSVSEHHTFPHAALLLVLSVSIIKYVPVFKMKYKYVVFSVSLLITALFITGRSPAMAKVYRDQTQCLSESMEFVTKASPHGLLLRDPYIPFDSAASHKAKLIWGLTWKAVDEIKPDLIGISLRFSQRYLVPPKAFLREEEKKLWGEKTEFYRETSIKNEFVSPSGRQYRLLYENPCGQRLFKLTEKPE